ncbi:hypothetical protein PCC7424_5343 [Gloeothece citriformis PCC 7424]|uniref:Uncharacterized protein n=1 Tax=Gloeothece citriformis (strain PCC 7424) TaxID=65393 RepID=B7KJL3_GLOC7|nr:hypothetical protein [Gloeothece citriformis]ACK73690.1 hypothetical protein PCC7424_5343 [Gloeothece citriformis PCC 7424]
MKETSFSSLNIGANILVVVLILYMFKTVMGIDLVAGCHAEEVLTDTCPPEKLIKKNN